MSDREFAAVDRVAFITWSRVDSDGAPMRTKLSVVPDGRKSALKSASSSMLRGPAIVQDMMDGAAKGCLFAPAHAAEPSHSVSNALSHSAQQLLTRDSPPPQSARSFATDSDGDDGKHVGFRSDSMSAMTESEDGSPEVVKRRSSKVVPFDEVASPHPPRRSSLVTSGPSSPPTGASHRQDAYERGRGRGSGSGHRTRSNSDDADSVDEHGELVKKHSVASSSASKGATVMFHKAVEMDSKSTESSLTLLRQILMLVSLSVVIITIVIYSLDQQTTNSSITSESIQQSEGDEAALLTVRAAGVMPLLKCRRIT